MTKHRISFLQEWNDHLTLNAEVLSKFLHDFRDLKTSGFSGQIFSITEVFAIWNKISGFRNVGKDCKALVVEARYILFDWTFLKLSKGRVSPVFTVNDGDKLLTMGLCIFEEAEEMNCHPDYLDELLENLRKIYQSNYKKAITELSSHIFHNKGILLFAEVLNAYIISTLINFKAFDENLLDLYGSVIQNIPQDMFPLLLGKLCRTFGKHKQVSELPRSFFKMFEMLFIKLKIWHRENTLEEHKPIVREYLVTILDLYLLCNDEHCPPQYFDLLDDLGESSRYKLLKIKISIKRKTPSNLFNHEVADYLKSFPTLVAAKPHIAELLDFVSESENLSFILDLVNHLIKTISGIFSVPLDQLSELGIYKCWLLANCSQQDDLHIFQDMKNFLTEILENSVETKQSSWESKSFHHIASILFEKAQDYHRVLIYSYSKFNLIILIIFLCLEFDVTTCYSMVRFSVVRTFLD